MKRLGLVLFLLVLAACSSDESTDKGDSGAADGAAAHDTGMGGIGGDEQQGGAGGETPGTGGTAGEELGTGGTAGEEPGTGGTAGEEPGTGGTAGTAGSGGGARVGDCADIDAKWCASNYECEDTTTRCEDVGKPGDDVSCCVPGERGTKKVGEACTSSNDCASGMCIDESMCGDVCKKDEDCPNTMRCAGDVLCIPK